MTGSSDLNRPFDTPNNSGVFMIIPSIPLVDLHRHLDGNIAPRTILKLAQKHQLPLANHSLAEIEKLTQVAGQTSDLMAFLAKLEVGVSVLDNTDACYEV
ncbi:MAG: adenosine deaminase, partial [Paraglaciecola sp.]